MGEPFEPSAPVGDVRPGTAVSVPMGEKSAVSIVSVSSAEEGSSSSSSSPSSDSSESSPGPRLRNRRLTIRIPTSDAEEASAGTEEGVTSTSPSRSPALRIAPTSSMTQAVTSSVIYTSQMEAGAEASPTIVWTSRARERLSRRQWGTSQPRPDHCESMARSSEGRRTAPQAAAPTEPPRIEWTPKGAGPGWASVETNSWGELEEAAQQSVQKERPRRRWTTPWMSGAESAPK